MDTFGKKEKKNPDWFKAGTATLEPAITAKRVALLNYKRERESLQQRHLLHSGRPETTLSGLLDNVPMTTGHTSRTAFNFFLSLATPAPCTRA